MSSKKINIKLLTCMLGITALSACGGAEQDSAQVPVSVGASTPVPTIDTPTSNPTSQPTSEPAPEQQPAPETAPQPKPARLRQHRNPSQRLRQHRRTKVFQE